MTALLLTLIPMLPDLIKAGFNIVEEVKRAIGDAPPQDRAQLDAKWNAIAARVDAADADWQAMKAEKGFT